MRRKLQDPDLGLRREARAGSRVGKLRLQEGVRGTSHVCSVSWRPRRGGQGGSAVGHGGSSGACGDPGGPGAEHLIARVSLSEGVVHGAVGRDRSHRRPLWRPLRRGTSGGRLGSWGSHGIISGSHRGRQVWLVQRPWGSRGTTELRVHVSHERMSPVKMHREEVSHTGRRDPEGDTACPPQVPKVPQSKGM